MGLPIRDQMKYWGVAGALFLVFLWFTGDVLLPFLIGAAIAYFLDPVADRLEAMGLSRAMATMVITLVALLIFVLMALLVGTLGRGALGEMIEDKGYYYVFILTTLIGFIAVVLCLAEWWRERRYGQKSGVVTPDHHEGAGS